MQEGVLRLHRARENGERIETPRAYLSTVVSRLSLDHLRSARRHRRETYVGDWLPEPLVVEVSERSIHTVKFPDGAGAVEPRSPGSCAFRSMVAPTDAAGQSAIAAMVSIIARRPRRVRPRNCKRPVVPAAPLPNTGASTQSRRVSEVNVRRCGPRCHPSAAGNPIGDDLRVEADSQSLAGDPTRRHNDHSAGDRDGRIRGRR